MIDSARTPEAYSYTSANVGSTPITFRPPGRKVRPATSRISLEPAPRSTFSRATP